MKKYLQSILLLLQFMTRIPINISLPCELEDFKRASSFIPIVGVAVGSFQLLVCLLLIKFLPVNMACIFVLLSGVFITGGFHIDGLGDTCDGFFAFKGGKEKIIEIMKDSRIGTYSCIAIIVDLLIRYTAYVTIVSEGKLYGLILAPIAGRISLEFIAFIGKRAKEKGSGNLFIGNIDKKQFYIGVSLMLVLNIIFLNFSNIFELGTVILVLFISTILFNSLCNNKIGGLTGDSLGANNEISELLCLIILCAFK